MSKPYRLYRFFNTLTIQILCHWYRFTNWLSTHLRGYSDVEWYSYYHINSDRAVELLTILRDRGHSWPTIMSLDCKYHGEEKTPDGVCSCKERWNQTLTDIIYYHQILSKNSSSDFKRQASQEDQQRFLRGKYYYSRYYEALWD